MNQIIKIEPELSLDELAIGIREAFVGCVKAAQEWKRNTIRLAELLYRARKHFNRNEDFSDWLARNGLGTDRLGKNDRAALIQMGEHIDIARDIIEQTERQSWRLVWDKEVKKVVHREIGLAEPKDHRPSSHGGNTVEEEASAVEPATSEPESPKDQLFYILDQMTPNQRREFLAEFVECYGTKGELERELEEIKKSLAEVSIIAENPASTADELKDARERAIGLLEQSEQVNANIDHVFAETIILGVNSCRDWLQKKPKLSQEDLNALVVAVNECGEILNNEHEAELAEWMAEERQQIEQQPKRKPGRPPGAKNKPKPLNGSSPPKDAVH